MVTYMIQPTQYSHNIDWSSQMSFEFHVYLLIFVLLFVIQNVIARRYEEVVVKKKIYAISCKFLLIL